MDALDRLEESIKKLKSAYEKYFAGIDRVAPERDRDEVKKSLNRLLGQHINNTAWRFRLQSLQASMVTHESYWNRVTRQIEEGTYRRDVQRARRKLADVQEPARPPPADPGPRAPLPPKQAAEQPGEAKRTTTEDEIARLHLQYNEARREAGETGAVSVETLARTVQKQTEILKRKYGCERVEFRVAVKNGKPILKAIPK